MPLSAAMERAKCIKECRPTSNASLIPRSAVVFRKPDVNCKSNVALRARVTAVGVPPFPHRTLDIFYGGHELGNGALT